MVDYGHLFKETLLIQAYKLLFITLSDEMKKRNRVSERRKSRKENECRISDTHHSKCCVSNSMYAILLFFTMCMPPYLHLSQSPFVFHTLYTFHNFPMFVWCSNEWISKRIIHLIRAKMNFLTLHCLAQFVAMRVKLCKCFSFFIFFLPVVVWYPFGNGQIKFCWILCFHHCWCWF